MIITTGRVFNKRLFHECSREKAHLKDMKICSWSFIGQTGQACMALGEGSPRDVINVSFRKSTSGVEGA